MFGNERSVSFAIDADFCAIIITDACLSFRGNQAPAIFRLLSFKNPGYVIQSDDFKITFIDANENMIASTSSGLSYKTTPGIIKVGEWSVQNPTVGELSQVTFSLQPQNPSRHPDVMIQITLPQDDFVLPTACLVKDNNEYIDMTTIDCQISVNTIKLMHVLKEPYTHSNSSFIELGINDIKMPSSERPTGMYQIDFFDKISNVYYLVDTVTFEDKIRAEFGLLEALEVTPQKNQTYSEDTFVFNITTAHAVPKGGTIEVILPNELKLQENATCKFENESQAYCILQASANQVKVMDLFNKDQVDVQAAILFSVSGIFTYRSSKSTSYFKFRTTDRNGYNIDQSNQYTLRPMQATRPIDFANASANSTIVGEIASYQFQFTSPVLLQKGDTLYLQGPETGFTKEIAYNYKACKGVDQLQPQLQCALKGINALLVTLDPLQESIDAESKFSFDVEQILNPQSTKQSSTFNAVIRDSQGYLIATLTSDKQKLESFVLQASEPSFLLFAKVVSESRVPKSETILKFMMLTRNELPARSDLIVQIPSLLKINKENFSCWIDSNADSNRNFTLTENEDNSKTLKIININSYKLFGGTAINFELRGLINDATSTVSKSFTILTTTDGYQVDQQLNGLNVSALCNYPCITCAVNQPDSCQTCDQDQLAPNPIYFQSKCLTKCPNGFFFSNNFCPQCDQNCLECFGQSKKCTKCDGNRYLLGNTCLNTCPDNFYNDKSGLCLPCELPCKTCKGSGSFCTSCDSTTPQYLFFANKCFETCPVDVSVFSEGRCLACSNNCNTCLTEFDTCTTCSGALYLNKIDLKCVQECPKMISVATKTALSLEVRQELTCEECQTNCLTCSAIDTQTCTKCREGLLLMEDSKACLNACPTGYTNVYKPESQDNICQKCDLGCSECIDSRYHCTICEPGFVFYKYQCLLTCPFEFRPDEKNICVYAKKPCKFGYLLNGETDECELQVAECKKGYVLNRKKDECIPSPVFHAPFFFVIISLIWTGYVLRTSNRSKLDKETIITQILCGVTLIQQLGYIVLLALSFNIGISFIITMHSISMIAQLFLNIGGLFAFLMLVKDDAFTHWRLEPQNKKNSKILFACSTVFSYKSIRLIISHLFDKAYFNAATEDRYRSFVRPMFVLNMIGLIQSGPALFINVYTIWLLKWRYEIWILSIESIMIGFCIFFLEVYEFILYKRKQPAYLGVADYVGGIVAVKAKRQNQVNVMGVEEADSSIIKVDERTSLTGKKGYYGQKVKIYSETKVLEGAIKRLTEAEKINRLKYELDEAQMTYLEDDTNEEEIRKCKLRTTVKHKQQQSRDKRKQFELHRFEKKQVQHNLQQIPELDINEIEHQKEEARQKQEKIRLAKEHRPILQEIDFKLLQKIDEDFDLMTQKSLDKSQITQYELFQTSLRRRVDEISEISKTKSQAHSKIKSESRLKKTNSDTTLHFISPSDLEKLSRTRRHFEAELKLCNLVKLQVLTDWELNDDNIQYQLNYNRFKAEFDLKAKEGKLVPNMKLQQSFDEDVMREMYHSMAAESDFDSELSWISYPPKHGFIRDFWENNPRKQAECVVFQDKIKYKYQYNNCINEVYPMAEPKPKLIKPSRRTQTLGAVYDPFASASEINDSSSEEALSAIDAEVGINIVNKVIYDGFTSDSTNTVISRINSARSVAQQASKKRQRSERLLSMHQLPSDRHKQVLDENELGTVFDSQGKVLYDKDYMSNIDDNEQMHISLSELVDDVDMEPISEPEKTVAKPDQQINQTISDSSDSDYKATLMTRKSNRKDRLLHKAYQPQLHLLERLGHEARSSVSMSRESRRSIVMSQKSRKSKKSTEKNQVVTSPAAIKKSETDDNKLNDDETRGNMSSAIDTAEKIRLHPVVHWEKADISEEQVSEDSRPFKFGNFASASHPQNDQLRQLDDQMRLNNYSLPLGVVKDLEDPANLSDALPDLQRLEQQGSTIQPNPYQQSRMYNESSISVRRPQPFANLGVESKPYKANTRKRQKQMVADQRRAMMPCAFNKLNKLENIYIKNSIAGQRLGMTNQNFNLPNFNLNVTKTTSQMVIPVTDEYMAAWNRHSSFQGDKSLRQAKKRIRRGLKKQNFIEDGPLKEASLGSTNQNQL